MSEEQGMASVLVGDEEVARVEYWLDAPGHRRQPRFGGISVADNELAGRLFNETAPIILRRTNKPDIGILIERMSPNSNELTFRIARYS